MGLLTVVWMMPSDSKQAIISENRAVTGETKRFPQHRDPQAVEKEIDSIIPFSYFKSPKSHPRLDVAGTLPVFRDRASVEKWRLKDRLVQGILMVGAANSGHLALVLNFVKSLEITGYPRDKFFMFGLDDKICPELEKQKVMITLAPHLFFFFVFSSFLSLFPGSLRSFTPNMAHFSAL